MSSVLRIPVGQQARQGSHAGEKPSMLMLSHCVPSPTGGPDRARAWQLLRVAAQTHDVQLACRYDGPVRLDQWYSIQRHAQKIVIETRWPLADTISQPLNWINAGFAERMMMTRGMERSVRLLAEDHEFNAVVCTHPSLWPLAATISTGLAVCDIAAPVIQEQRRLSYDIPSLRRWWGERQARSRGQAERRAARECSVLTVSRSQDLLLYSDEHCKTVLLPMAVDLDYFSPAIAGALEETAPSEIPRLVFHANWNHSAGVRAREWFTRRIWPSVVDAVPHATLSDTQSSSKLSPSGVLREASVVISPDPDPGASRWPILEAMALHRPVVASGEAVGDMGVRHGEHMLLSRRTDDWVEHCIASLRSASMRLQLARGARAYVERHSPIVTTGNHLLETLRPAQVKLRAA